MTVGMFRIELNSAGEVFVDIRIPGFHHRVIIAPTEEVDAAMARLAIEFEDTLNYELTDGEKNLVIAGLALIENSRSEARDRLGKRAKVQARVDQRKVDQAAARQAEIDAAVKEGVRAALDARDAAAQAGEVSGP